MSGSRLPAEGPGFLPRKVAELARSEERIADSLDRASSLVRAVGLSPRVLERIVLSDPCMATDALAIAGRGVCGNKGATYPDLLSALSGPGGSDAAKAALVASFAAVVRACLERTMIAPTPVIASAWANAETAHWLAGKHIVAPDEAFVTALFMDAGLAAMMYSLPEVYDALSQSNDPRSVWEFERDSFGFDHQEVGAAVLARCKFPEGIAEFAAVHHKPSLEQDMVGKVLHAASVAVESVGGDFGLATPAPELDVQTLESALLKASDAAEVKAYASARLEAALAFRWPAGSQAA